MELRFAPLSPWRGRFCSASRHRAGSSVLFPSADAINVSGQNRRTDTRWPRRPLVFKPGRCRKHGPRHGRRLSIARRRSASRAGGGRNREVNRTSLPSIERRMIHVTEGRCPWTSAVAATRLVLDLTPANPEAWFWSRCRLPSRVAGLGSRCFPAPPRRCREAAVNRMTKA